MATSQQQHLHLVNPTLQPTQPINPHSHCVVTPESPTPCRPDSSDKRTEVAERQESHRVSDQLSHVVHPHLGDWAADARGNELEEELAFAPVFIVPYYRYT